MQLDPRQAEAVELSGIQLILAGPGSGKTRVITKKVARPLEAGVDPAAVLALTFSEKATQEMADRIARQAAGVEVAVHTFHSFCLSVLRDHVLDPGIALHAGIISGTNRLVWPAPSATSRSASSAAGAYAITNAGAVPASERPRRSGRPRVADHRRLTTPFADHETAFRDQQIGLWITYAPQTPGQPAPAPLTISRSCRNS